KNRRRIGVIQLFQVAQSYHFTILFGQRQYSLAQGLQQLRVVQIRQYIQVACQGRFTRTVKRFVIHRQVQPSSLHDSPGQVARDTEEIARDRTLLRLVSSGLADQQHEDFLGYLFRGGAVAAHMQDKTVKRALVSLVQAAKRRLIPFGELPQQLLVCGWRFGHDFARGCLPGSCYPLRGWGESFHYFLPEACPGRPQAIRRTARFSVIWWQRESCSGTTNSEVRV